MRTLVKGLRAVQLYLPNNPVYRRAVASVQQAFQAVWSDLTDVELEIQETEIRWEEHPIYSEPDKPESLAWLLYKDGVRTLTFLSGVEEEEIVAFLGVLHEVRNLPQDAEDDLLTLLWEQDFQGIQYRFVELSEGHELGPAEPQAPPSPDMVRQQVRQEVVEPEPQAVVNLEAFDASLYVLDEHELDYLKRELEREYKQDLRANILAILFDVFELQTHAKIRADVIAIIEEMIPQFLGLGDFRSVSYVLRELRVILPRGRELIPEHRHALEQLPAKLSQGQVFAQLLQSLDEAVESPTEEELGAFFSELRPQALQTAVGWLPRLTNPQVRSLLDAAVQRLAQAHPKAMSAALATDDPEALLSAIRLVKWLRLPVVAPDLGRLLDHPEPSLRAEVVAALGEIGSSSAMQHLERAIDDSDRDVRIAAVRVLGHRRRHSVLGRIESAISGRGLRSADLTERLAYYEAFGLIAGSQGIPLLTRTLQARGFMRREDPQTRACAAMALGKISTPAARAVLEKASDDREPLVRNAVRKALREMG